MQPVPHRPPSVLVGGHDSQTPRVRHPLLQGADHQAGLDHRAVGGHGVRSLVRYHGGAQIAPAYRRIAERRGNNIARVAAARKLLTLVFYGLRDGEIRRLNRRLLEQARTQPRRELDERRGPHEVAWPSQAE